MYFPVAFQVLFLALLATVGWAANLQWLSRAGIEVRPILQLSQAPNAHRAGERADDRLHQGIYRLAAILGSIALAGWVLCTLSASADTQTRITLLTYLVAVAVVVWPQRILCHTVRMQFIESLVRIVRPSLTSPVYLSDVVMADILTSCARMLADMCLVVCQFGVVLWSAAAGSGITAGAAGNDSDIDVLADTVRTKQMGAMCTDPGIIGAVLVASPYAFRLRQCINEYLRAPAGSGDAKRHFANAVKYASAFPVICLSATQKRVAVDGLLETTPTSDWALRAVFGLWMLAVGFNSLYSFYWDIAFDWDLGHQPDGWRLSDLIAPARSPSTHRISNSSTAAAGPDESVIASGTSQVEKPYDDHILTPAHALDEMVSAEQPSLYPLSSQLPMLLRPHLCFLPHAIYYFAILTDFFLRISWTMKLSSHIQIDTMAYGGFWLNVLEIYRRWQWTFLRIEKEAAARD
ncbi:protein-ER retention protein [Dipsacomyces acuminosporus]|nr:protein-ER retention protein [Dipsacomyces acuminosporus]